MEKSNSLMGVGDVITLGWSREDHASIQWKAQRDISKNA